MVIFLEITEKECVKESYPTGLLHPKAQIRQWPFTCVTKLSCKRVAELAQLLLIGDFNYPEINFEDNDVNAGEGSAPDKCFTCVHDLFLYQHVTECPGTEGTRNRVNWIMCLLTMKILHQTCSSG